MTRKTQRIEPTLSGEPHQLDEQILQQAAQSSNYKTRRQSKAKNDLPQQVIAKVWAVLGLIKNVCQEKVFINKRINIIIAGLLTAIIVVTLLVAGFSSDEQPSDLAVPPISEKLHTVNLTNRGNQVTLPDNFSVFTTDYSGIVIGWRAETSQEQKLWDIQTAEGDKSCQAITFNNGDSYRALNVMVESEQQYYANFSPLDNSNIIKALALRGSFTLCGYQFSLKGSQAVLGKHPFYSELLLN